MMLTGPGQARQSTADAETDTKRNTVDWEARASRLEAEVEEWRARTSSLHAEMERLSAKAQGLETAADQSHAQVSDLQAEVDAWKTRVAQLRNREADVRRQALHQAELSIHEERQRLLEHMLGVADNLERALAHADEHDPLYAGVRLSLDDLLGKLAKEGVEPLKAVGKTFDPNVHEAVAVDGSGGSRVVKVLETGYTLNGELLRPARVIVGGAAA